MPPDGQFVAGEGSLDSISLVGSNGTVIDDFTTFLHHAWNDAFWLSGLLVLLTLLGCFCCHHSDLRQRLIGARMRIASCSVIYRKTLRMSKKAAGQTPAGYMINLLSNDVSRLDYGFIYIHYVWVLPFQVNFRLLIETTNLCLNRATWMFVIYLLYYRLVSLVI